MLLINIALACVFPVCTGSQTETTPAQADYYSANRVYVLHITPDQNQPARQGWCLAELYKTNGEDRTLVWKRYLINNFAPANALVADSGKYVVGVGDWEQLDTVPLVVYGAQGEVRTLLTSDTPLPGAAHAECGATVLGEGSMRALLYFGLGDTTLIIHLAGNDTYTLCLEHGLLTDRDWYSFATNNCGMSREDCEALKAFARKRLAEMATEYMQSADVRLRETGAIVAGELHLREAVPHLQQLLQDKPQHLDPQRVKTRFPMGMGGLRVDPAQAARSALGEIAEYQEQSEKETLVPKDAADKSAWAQFLDRGQQTKDPAPLESFLNRWQSDRQGIAPEVLQSKPEFEQAIYAMFPPFFLPEASQKTTKYLIVQDEIKVRLVDGDLADDYRRELADFEDHAGNRPAISELTISDFRPNVKSEGRNVLYVDDFHVDVLARYLTGKHDADLADSYWDEPNGEDEFDEGPYSERLSYVNQSLHIIRGHWGTGWYFPTHPEIELLVLNKDFKTAVIYCREGYGGSIALMQRDDQGWRVLGRESTWVE